MTVSGGCQCGAVRYRIDGALTRAHLCHCRMCQKAAGSYFMALANVSKPEFSVTSGEISWFQSSEPVRRGFCRECGTPLIFETLSAAHLNVTLGSLDDPSAVKPETQWGLESRMPWFKELGEIPGAVSADDETGRLGLIERTNRQHPDHDT